MSKSTEQLRSEADSLQCQIDVAGDNDCFCIDEYEVEDAAGVVYALNDAADTITELTAERDQAKAEARQQYVNAAFFRSCALSGGLPALGDEPYPPTTEGKNNGN